MLYFVECGFNSPTHEDEWNDFYSNEKLPALISVQGFISSQRFVLLRGSSPTYLAIHDIVSADVLDSEQYFEQGGGNFARWQSYITDWRRNVYDGSPAPIVSAQECLVLCDDVNTAERYGLSHLKAVALHKDPAERWIGKLSAEQAAAISKDTPIDLYRPLGDALFAINHP